MPGPTQSTAGRVSFVRLRDRSDRELGTRRNSMLRNFTKRRALVTGAVFVLLTAGAAVAYFTTSGSGTGTAAVGTSSALTIHGTSASTLYPGASSTVSYTVDNPSSGHQ